MDEDVKTLGAFTDLVSKHRHDHWRVPEKQELWFRGECKRHDGILRPSLYRPSQQRNLKPIPELLEIENHLYEDFQRCAIQLCSSPPDAENWEWDSYFLMQHHGAPTRLLDWSDGALMALHFALRDERKGDTKSPVVYVVEPYRLMDILKNVPEVEIAKSNWKEYVKKHPSDDLSEDRWEDSYLPDDKSGLEELSIPTVPCLLEFPHITRRVAAQRSRFMVFGTNPNWLSEEFAKPDSAVRAITIDAASVSVLRMELRDSGITESVIFPDLDGLGREMRQLWEDRR